MTSSYDQNTTAEATTTTTTTTIDPQALEDALDDVHTRFILNLPPEELASADRIFFQIEQAWWFYEDMICDALTTTKGSLPRYPTLKPFALQMFTFSPVLDAAQFHPMWGQFSAYKRTISTYGTILLNQDATHIVLCQIWNGNTWTLPAGKINQGETGVQAATRETFEETGFDPHCLFGTTKEWLEGQNSHFISWNRPLKETDALSYQDPNGKRRTVYVCLGVPMDFAFAPVARKEVSDIAWFPLDDLPKKSFAILPFMGKLRKWIRMHTSNQQHQDRPKSRPKSAVKNRDKSNSRDKSAGRDSKSSRSKRSGSAGRDGNKKGGGNRNSNSKGRLVQNDANALVHAGLVNVGEMDRWSEEEMFKTNEAILGRKVDYDGNPHVFAEQGFRGIDPHAFRVVGGTFMNSGEGLSQITKDDVQYQPLVREENDDNDTDFGNGGGSALPLTPFFTSDGATPWGEVVEEAKRVGEKNSPKQHHSADANAGEALLAMLQGKAVPPPSTNNNNINNTTKKQHHHNNNNNNNKNNRSVPPITTTDNDDDDDDDIDVLTDAQITKRRQALHKAQKASRQEKYHQDMQFVQNWVANLPNPVGFRIKNIDVILKNYQL